MLQKNLEEEVRVFVNFLATFTYREMYILTERFSKKKSLNQVAKHLHITSQRVKDIEDYLIKKIKLFLNFN